MVLICVVVTAACPTWGISAYGSLYPSSGVAGPLGPRPARSLVAPACSLAAPSSSLVAAPCLLQAAVAAPRQLLAATWELEYKAKHEDKARHEFECLGFVV